MEFFRRDPNDFLSRLVTMDETWLYHYDPETSNNQWNGGIGAHPASKISERKIRWKISRLDIWGSRRHHPHCLSSKRPNYRRGVLVISADAIEGYFEGKTPREGHQGGPVLARQCPGSPGTCNPKDNGLPGLPISWSPTLFSGFGPVGIPPVPWNKKQTIGRSPFSSDTEVIAAAETWLDGQFSFLSGLQKLEERAKKCIELRGGYVE